MPRNSFRFVQIVQIVGEFEGRSEGSVAGAGYEDKLVEAVGDLEGHTSCERRGCG